MFQHLVARLQQEQKHLPPAAGRGGAAGWLDSDRTSSQPPVGSLIGNSALNSVDLIRDVVGSPVLNLVNHRRLLIDCFGQLFLSEFLGNSCSLDGLCALVTHNLVLNLFIFILDGVKVSNCTRLVVNGVNVVLSALDGTSCEVAVRLASILFELVLIVLLLCFPLLLRLHCLPLH